MPFLPSRDAVRRAWRLEAGGLLWQQASREASSAVQQRDRCVAGVGLPTISDSAANALPSRATVKSAPSVSVSKIIRL